MGIYIFSVQVCDNHIYVGICSHYSPRAWWPGILLYIPNIVTPIMVSVIVSSLSG